MALSLPIAMCVCSCTRARTRKKKAERTVLTQDKGCAQAFLEAYNDAAASMSENVLHLDSRLAILERRDGHS